MKNMDRWLGDGGMPVIEAVGAAFDAYGDGWATAAWKPTVMACNPHGIVQAGVHSVLLDAAMNFAINASLEGKDRTKATLEMKTDCIRAALKDETLTIRGEVVRMTKQIAFGQAAITNEKGEVVSRSTGTFLVHRDAPA
jgi:uncharacterized protein (TIGR00369 family)